MTGKPQLVAQAHTKKGPWHPKRVFNVTAMNNSYEPGSSFRFPPNEFNVLSMASIRSAENGTASYIYTDKRGRLILFNDSGKIEWTGEEGFGGSTLSYEIPKDSTSFSEKQFEYFQPTNIVYDMKSDGKTELFVVKNVEASNYLFENARSFKRGGIEIHTINDLGISFENVPKKFPGMVTGMAVNDYDNDSKDELLVTMIKTGNRLSNSVSSVVVAYELE